MFQPAFAMIERLWKEYNRSKSNEARERLIMACLPYVKSSAHRLSIYSAPSQDANDLVSAGIIGLMDALERYDPVKGASFKNYSSYRIRGAIMDEIRSMDWVPYSTREKARKIEKKMQELEQNSDKPPDEEDMAKAMGMSLGKYYETLMEISRMTLSLLEETFYDGDNTGASDANHSNDPEMELVQSETVNILGDAIEKLPEKERLVITLYYYEEMTMKEIGETLDVSESRICQIHSSAIIRLHTRLKAVRSGVSV